MQFGFNAWTDEAREALENAGIQYRRTPQGVEIFTNAIDRNVVERREVYGDTIIAESEKPRLKQEGLKVWKHPDTGDYYYLISGIVFKKYSKYATDNRTDPPTKFEFSVFDFEDEQTYWRDFFNSIPLFVDSPAI